MNSDVRIIGILASQQVVTCSCKQVNKYFHQSTISNSEKTTTFMSILSLFICPAIIEVNVNIYNGNEKYKIWVKNESKITVFGDCTGGNQKLIGWMNFSSKVGRSKVCLYSCEPRKRFFLLSVELSKN